LRILKHIAKHARQRGESSGADEIYAQSSGARGICAQSPGAQFIREILKTMKFNVGPQSEKSLSLVSKI